MEHSIQAAVSLVQPFVTIIRSETNIQGMTLTFPSTRHSDKCKKISLSQNYYQLVHAVQSYTILFNFTSPGD